MKKKDKPARSPELEAAVRWIGHAIRRAEPYVMATEQNTHEALATIYEAVLPHVDLSEPNAYGLRTATAQPALLAYYADNGCKVREGDNWFGPAVKLGFKRAPLRTPNALYAKVIAACIELGPKSPRVMLPDHGSMDAVIDEWETSGGGYARSKLAKARAAAAKTPTPTDNDISWQIAQMETLREALEQEKLQANALAKNYTTERERREAAEKRAEEADARAKEYRAKWEAAEAKLAALSQPARATGTALVLYSGSMGCDDNNYAPPRRKRGRPRKHPVATMAAE